MFVLDALKSALKTAAKLEDSAHGVKPGAVPVIHFNEIDDIIESLRAIDDIADAKFNVNGISVRPIETAIRSIDNIYMARFGTRMPADVLNTLRSGVRRIVLEHMVGNRLFMNERADSAIRIMEKVAENVVGYRDALDRIYMCMRDSMPVKPVGNVTMTGRRYRIIVPAAAITTGVGSYVFYKAFIKSVCENNILSGCIWTRSGEKCKIVSATCATAYKHTDARAMPECRGARVENACTEWTGDTSICKSCNAMAASVKTGSVECVEAPIIGAIIMDTMDTGFGGTPPMRYI